MLIKNFKILFLFTLISIVNSSCASVQKAFDPERKNSSEEFLVEKKMPLSMPPNFDDLPVPQEENSKDEQDDGNMESLILGGDQENQSKKDNGMIDSGVENSILDKIKNN